MNVETSVFVERESCEQAGENTSAGAGSKDQAKGLESSEGCPTGSKTIDQACHKNHQEKPTEATHTYDNFEDESEEETELDLLNMEDFEVVDAFEEEEDPSEFCSRSRLPTSGAGEDSRDTQVTHTSATTTDKSNRSRESGDKNSRSRESGDKNNRSRESGDKYNRSRESVDKRSRVHSSKDSSELLCKRKSSESSRRHKRDDSRGSENSCHRYNTRHNRKKGYSEALVDEQYSARSARQKTKYSKQKSNSKQSGEYFIQEENTEKEAVDSKKEVGKCKQASEVPQQVCEVPQQACEVPQQACEVPQQACEVPQQACEVPQQACEVPQQVCEVPQQACEVPQQACEVPQQVCEVPQEACEVPQQACEVPQQACEVPQQVCEVPQQASEVPQQASEVSQQASEVPQQASEVPQQACEVPQQVCEVPQQACEVPQQASEVPQQACEVPQQVCEVPQQVCEVPQQVCEVPQQACEVPQQASEVPQQACEVPQQVCEVPQQACEVPQQASEVPQQASEVPQQACEVPRQVCEVPQQACEVPQQASEVPQQAIEVPQQACEVPQQACDVPQQACAVPQQVCEVPQQACEVPQQASEVPQQACEVPQQASEVPLQASEVPQQACEVPQQACEVPQQACEVPQQASEVPLQASEVPQQACEVPQQACEVPQQACEETKEVSEGSKEVSEESTEVREESKEVSEESKEVSAESKEVSEGSTEVSEESTEVREESKEVSEESKGVSEESKGVSEESKEVSEESKEVSEESKEASEESKEASEESKEASEESQQESFDHNQENAELRADVDSEQNDSTSNCKTGITKLEISKPELKTCDSEDKDGKLKMNSEGPKRKCEAVTQKDRLPQNNAKGSGLSNSKNSNQEERKLHKDDMEDKKTKLKIKLSIEQEKDVSKSKQEIKDTKKNSLTTLENDACDMEGLIDKYLESIRKEYATTTKEHVPDNDKVCKKVFGEPHMYRFSKVVIIGDSRIKILEDIGMKSTFGPLEIKCVPDLTLDNLEEVVKSNVDKSNCPRGILLICSVGIYDMIELNNNLSCEEMHDHVPMKQISDTKHSIKNKNHFFFLVNLRKELMKLFCQNSSIFFTTILPVLIPTFNRCQTQAHKITTGHNLGYSKKNRTLWLSKMINMEVSVNCEVSQFNSHVSILSMRGDRKKIIFNLLPNVRDDGQIFFANSLPPNPHNHLDDGLNPSRYATEKYMVPMLKYTIKQYHMNRYQEVVVIGDSRLQNVWPKDGQMITIYTQRKLSFGALTDDNPIVKEITGKKDALIVLSLGMYDILKFVAQDGCDSHKIKLELPSLCLENLDSSDKLWNDFVHSLKSVDRLLRKVTTNCDVIITTIYPFDFVSLQNYLVEKHAEETGHHVTIPSQSIEIKDKLNRIEDFILIVNKFAFTLAEEKQLPVWDFYSLVFSIYQSANNVPLFDGFHPTPDIARKIAEACVKFADNSLYVCCSNFSIGEMEDEDEYDRKLLMRQPDLSTVLEIFDMCFPPLCNENVVKRKWKNTENDSSVIVTPFEGEPSTAGEDSSALYVNKGRDCISPGVLSSKSKGYICEKREDSLERQNSVSQNSLFEPVSPSSMQLSSPDFEDKNSEFHCEEMGSVKSNKLAGNDLVNYTDSYLSSSQYGTPDQRPAIYFGQPTGSEGFSKSYSLERVTSPCRYGSKVSHHSGGRYYSAEIGNCYDQYLSSPERSSRWERCHSPVKQDPLNRDETWRQSPRRSCSPVQHSAHSLSDRVSSERLRQDRKHSPWKREMRSPTFSPHWKRVRSRSISRSRLHSSRGRREVCGSSRGRTKEHGSKHSVIVCALHSLREVHDRECDKYRKNPIAHPDYTKEYRKFVDRKRERILSLGGDPNTYDMTKEWEIFWQSRLETIFNESWTVKRDECLSMLPVNKSYSRSPSTSCSVSSDRSSDASSYNYRNLRKKRAKHSRSPSVHRKKKVKKIRKNREKSDNRGSTSHYEDKGVQEEKRGAKHRGLIRKGKRDGHFQSPKHSSSETSLDNDILTGEKGSSCVASQRLNNVKDTKEKLGMKKMEGIIDEFLQFVTVPVNIGDQAAGKAATSSVTEPMPYVSNEAKCPTDRNIMAMSCEKMALMARLSEKTSCRLQDSPKTSGVSFPQKEERLKLYTTRHLPKVEVTFTTPTESFTAEVIDVLELLSHLGERLGTLQSPVKLLQEKALMLKSSGLDAIKIFDEIDNKILLHMTVDKLRKALKDDTINIIQKIITREAEEKLSLLLEKEKDRSLLYDLNINSIASACLGKNAAEITTFIENALMYLGHTEVPQDQLMRIHMAVKTEQAKIFSLSKNMPQGRDCVISKPLQIPVQPGKPCHYDTVPTSQHFTSTSHTSVPPPSLGSVTYSQSHVRNSRPPFPAAPLQETAPKPAFTTSQAPPQPIASTSQTAPYYAATTPQMVPQPVPPPVIMPGSHTFGTSAHAARAVVSEKLSLTDFLSLILS